MDAILVGAGLVPALCVDIFVGAGLVPAPNLPV